MIQRIYCLECKSAVVRTEDNVCLNCGAVQWGYVKKQKSKISVERAVYKNPKVALFSTRNILVACFFLAIGLSLFHILRSNKSAFISKVSPNLFLLKNFYVYTVKLTLSDDRKIQINLIKKTGNVFDLYNSDSSQPNMVIANAIMIDSSGRCITSRYAVEPWNNKQDVENLNILIMKETENKEVDSIIITGQSVFMTITPWKRDSSEDDDSKTIQCISSNIPAFNSANIAYIERKERTGLMQVKNILLANNASFFIINKTATIIALSQNFVSSSFNTNSIPVSQEVTIEKDSTIWGISISTNKSFEGILMEGAPIFNKDGELFAINTHSIITSLGFYNNRAFFIL